MKDYHALLGYFSGILMSIGMIPYLHSIVITRITKPNRTSYGIWMIIGIINLCAYIASGEKETIWFVISGALFPLIIFSLSFRYGEKCWYRSDTWCLCLALFAIVIWKLTGNPILALVSGLIADALAVIPTLIKIKRNPNSENLLGWSFGFVSSIFNVLAVKEWTWSNGIYTIYMVSSFTVIIVPLAVLQYRNKHSV